MSDTNIKNIKLQRTDGINQWIYFIDINDICFCDELIDIRILFNYNNYRKRNTNQRKIIIS